ncbi:MAG: thioredoxin-dependent thiol peroxidase [Bdellovibrionales bacterium]|nr:thioredoxin-dependent thiol peroxidase [Bdellovibrionales bacterium]
MSMLEAGTSLPAFSLLNDQEQTIKKKDLLGKYTVLYFYPKDQTPGCTKEACGFKKHHRKLANRGVQVIGVSKDSIRSHQKFIDKYKLPFSLLSDPDYALAKSLGAFGEKKLYGKSYEGVIRSTFIIDPKGKIEKVFDKVKAASHPDEIMEYFQTR